MNENVVKLDYRISIKAIIFLIVLLIGISIESRMLQIILQANDTLLINVVEKTIFVYLLMAVGLSEYGLSFKNVLFNEGDKNLIILSLSFVGSFLITYFMFQPRHLTTYLLPILSIVTPNQSLTADPRALTTVVLALVIMPLQNVFLYYRFLLQGLLNNHNNILITIIFTLAIISLHNFFTTQFLFIAVSGLYFIFLYLKTRSTLILLLNQIFINLIVLVKFM